MSMVIYLKNISNTFELLITLFSKKKSNPLEINTNSLKKFNEKFIDDTMS